MKQVARYTVALCIICVVYLGFSRSAFSREDYIHWNLPDDVIARVGKGNVGTGDRAIAFSPDGKLLAVASGIGIWLYDPHAQEELALLTGHTGVHIQFVCGVMHNLR